MHQSNFTRENVVLPVDCGRTPDAATDLSDEMRVALKDVLTVAAGKIESHLSGQVRQAVEGRVRNFSHISEGVA